MFFGKVILLSIATSLGPDREVRVLIKTTTRRGVFYLLVWGLECINLSSWFFNFWSFAAVCLREDGTEHSDVNLKPVWF